MALNELELRERARAAYERGRWAAALRTSAVALPVGALGLLHATRWPLTAGAAAALLGALALFGWRGGALGRAVWPGVLAGAVPLLLPALVPAGFTCEVNGACWSLCLLVCPLSGLVAGAVVGALAARQRAPRLTFLAAATGLAAGVGMFGCVIAGSAGVVGMLLGSALGMAPAYAWVTLRAHRA